ncbi:MAG: 2-C-methyl-D-erythritol 2,4-cyclodiphosphate synthase [Gammaproteobacteria bacterium]
MKVGQGFDVHAFGPGEFVMLGGVRVPHSAGVVAHSDGDVVLHALCDALLGAAGLGDIGQHFSDKDPRWKGADSAQFVTVVLQMLSARKLRVGNVDITVIAEVPKVGPVRDAIRTRVAELLQVPPSEVNVKATTTERLGFLGRSEGIAAQAIALLVDA